MREPAPPLPLPHLRGADLTPLAPGRGPAGCVHAREHISHDTQAGLTARLTVEGYEVRELRHAGGREMIASARKKETSR